MSEARRTAFVWAAVLLALLAFVAARLIVSTDISEFIPTGEDQTKAKISQAIVRSPLLQTIVLTLEAADAPSAVAASQAFETAARSDPQLMASLAFIDSGPPAGLEQTLWELYQPRRFAFAGIDEHDLERRLTDLGLRDTVADLEQRLRSPLSPLVSRLAPEDPFLALPRLMERLERERPRGLDVVAGRFVAQHRYAVLFLGTHRSAFDATAQRDIFARLHACFAEVQSQYPELELEMSGVGRFAIQAEATIKADIQRTTILSVVGLLALGIALFRSVHLVALSMIPIVAGFTVASAVSIVVFGQVHGLTLAFGASLIGVCIDYVAHFYVHHTLRPHPLGPPATLRKIWPGLRTGAVTTIAGFVVMAGSSFPGLQQISLFASVGVAAALLSTRFILPALVPATPPPVHLRAWLADRLVRWFGLLQRNPRWLGVLALSAVVLTVAGLTTTQWDDDLRQMNQLDPKLVAEDDRVRERVARFEPGTFVVAIGDTEEAALQVNDAVANAMRAAVAAGEVVAWQNVASLVPSAARQTRIHQTLASSLGLRSRLDNALASAGFHPEAFAPFYRDLAAEPPPPLRFDDLARSGAGVLVRPFRLEIGDQIGFLTFVRGITSAPALNSRLDAIEGAVYIDQANLIRSANLAYRTRAVQLVWVGLLAVFAVLLLRYRDVKTAIAAFVPAILAAGATIGVLAAARIPLSLMGVTALLMILSMGVDYGVFLVESLDEDEGSLQATLLGLMVAALTTVLGFGVLALSIHPAMRTIGIIAAVGVAASLLLAPIAPLLVLASHPRK